MAIGLYQRTNRLIPIIGKMADNDDRPIIGASVVLIRHVSLMGQGSNVPYSTGQPVNTERTRSRHSQ